MRLDPTPPRHCPDRLTNRPPAHLCLQAIMLSMLAGKRGPTTIDRGEKRTFSVNGVRRCAPLRRKVAMLLAAGGTAPLLRHAACLLACARHLGPRAAVQGGGAGDLAQSPELLGRPLSPVVSEQVTSRPSPLNALGHSPSSWPLTSST